MWFPYKTLENLVDKWKLFYGLFSQFDYLFMPAEFRNETINFNATAATVHATEFAALLEHVGPAWNNWVEIFSDPSWMSLISEFPMDWTEMFDPLQ